MGSGSLNAMAMFESKYRDGMEKAEAMDLVSRAIQFGMSSSWDNRKLALFVTERFTTSCRR